VLARAPHDFYHLPAYVELSSRTTDQGEPVGLLVRDGERALLQAAVLRDIPGESRWRDATSPYGYPGPLLAGAEPSNPFAASALEALSAELRSRGVLALFVRLHPLLNEDCSVLGSRGTLVQHGETVVVDLSLPEDELWRQTQSGHRNEINRARRAGHQVFIDDQWSHYDGFRRLYRETMGRVEASSYYFFDDDYFDQLRSALGPRLHLAGVEIGGALAAAGLFTEVSGVVQYHLSGMSEAFARERPTKLMLDHVRSWAKSRGNRWLHLGGGLGGAQDSLFRFKAGFSKLRRAFCTWRLVTDEAAYRRLVAAKHPGAHGDDRTGYFPEYRRPPEPA